MAIAGDDAYATIRRQPQWNTGGYSGPGFASGNIINLDKTASRPPTRAIRRRVAAGRC